MMAQDEDEYHSHQKLQRKEEQEAKEATKHGQKVDTQ